MLFKLALKNIKKSFKDYAIYFFTLVFAVALFYTFNSIDAQTSMSMLTDSTKDVMESIVTVIKYLSVFVAVILGFLIVYANNFLIKRRKKEFGLYLTLGMSKRKVAIILVLETLFVGLISLGAGLILGCFMSQLLSLLTIKMFEINLSAYRFIFSLSALKETIFDFSIIYILVILFDTFSITRFKLIDLMTAGKRNEKIRLKNNILIFLTFILAIILIGYGYYMLFNNALLDGDDTKLIVMIISGSLGTLCLFYSLSSIIMKLVKHIPNLYYKSLNCFVLKQVNNKINTTVVSNTIISLMLMLTIAILSVAISLSSVSNNGFKSNNLIDYTIRLYDIDDTNVSKVLNDSKFKEYSSNYLLLHEYENENVTVGKLLTDDDKKILVKEYGEETDALDSGTLPIISLTEYNAFMKLTNQDDKVTDLSDNEYLLLCNLDMAMDKYNNYYSKGGTIKIDDKVLVPKTTNIIKTAIENSNVDSNSGVVVVSDNNITASSSSMGNVILGNYNQVDYSDAYDQEFIDYINSNTEGIYLTTKTYVKNTSSSLTVLLTFIGLYLGITFAIASATVLAIGQLSESSDNKERYNVLKKIGADEHDINKSLFKQIAIAFGFPLIVGIIHSLVGLKEINKLIKMFGSIDVTKSILLVSLFIIILYGGYFLVTYYASKKILKN